MRTRIIILLLFVFLLINIGTGEILPENEAAAAQIQVINLSIDPAILMPYDTATVTITLTNTGTKSVAISRADLYSKEFKILSDSYGKVGAIGAGNTMSFTYTIRAGGLTGIFYPVFSVDFRDANFLRYPFRVLVQENQLEVSVLNKPETFVPGKKEELIIHVGNPRDNPVTSVTVVPRGPGHEITPTSFFSGVLAPDSSVDIPFSVTPYGETPIEFTVQYQNGINQHEVTYTLPVETRKKSRKQADTILSNVQVDIEKDHFRVTGDVTNSGLETANAVLITTAEPAVPVFPFKVYAVGALKPDDFSSFEVTFHAGENVTEIPLRASFKDDDGNEFFSDTMVELGDSHEPKVKQDEEGLSPVIIGVLVVIALGVAGIVLHSRRPRG
jgi:hypothetical protein